MVAIWPLALGRLTGRFRPIYGNRGSGQFFAVVKTAGYASSHGSGCRGYSVNSCADRPLDGTPKGRIGDKLVRSLTLFGNTMPNFFTALLLLYVVALKLNWLPVIARHNEPTALILPTITLVWSMSAKYIQQIRALALDELSKPYITGLRTSGLSWYMIYSRYILRAIAGPIVALVSLSCGSLLGGVTIVETIFMWDGVGKMAFDAITARDYPVLQAYVLWLAAFIFYSIGARIFGKQS